MTCPDCEKLQKRVERLEAENERLKRIVAELRKRCEELERMLRLYENAHTPPSMRYATSRKSSQVHEQRKPGQKNGHKGITRARAKPDKTVEVVLERCPHCNRRLGKPTRIESKIIEEIPEPQPVTVIEFLTAHYYCSNCGRHVVASHPGCPKEGRFGKNVLAQTTLLKYEERLPHRKIQQVLERQFGLIVSPSSIFDFTRRVSDSLRHDYHKICQKIKNSKVVYIDETGIKVNGKLYWIWVFTTDTETLVVVRRSRSGKVLREVLGRNFRGIIVCDGWKPYSSFTKNIQRCWAHLLRESDYLAKRVDEAVLLSNALHRIYSHVKDFLEAQPSPEERERMKKNAMKRLKYWINKSYRNPTVKQFITKIENGIDYWFTYVVNPGVEPTNNRAERELREHVVQRKIIGTLRNEKGTRIYETNMTVLTTWRQQGLNTFEMLITKI